jgi:hypothetical protein
VSRLRSVLFVTPGGEGARSRSADSCRPSRSQRDIAIDPSDVLSNLAEGLEAAGLSP